MFKKQKIMQISIESLTSENNDLKKQIRRLEEQIRNIQFSLSQKEAELEKVSNLLYTSQTDENGHTLCSPSLRVARLNHKSLAEQWNLWGASVHLEQQQLLRQDRARAINYTPLSIDAVNGSGQFQGSNNTTYIATLCDCTCTDFERRHLPCKHMYRLAYELDLFLLDDVTELPDGIRLIDLDNFKKILLSLPNSYFGILRDIFVSDEPRKVEVSFSIKKLLDLHILQISSNTASYLNSFTKDQLLSFLPQDYKKSTKKADIVNDVSHNEEVLAKIQETYVSVEPSLAVSHIKSEIAHYLSTLNY